MTPGRQPEGRWFKSNPATMKQNPEPMTPGFLSQIISESASKVLIAMQELDIMRTSDIHYLQFVQEPTASGLVNRRLRGQISQNNNLRGVR
jgi:hypothetical protein